MEDLPVITMDDAMDRIALPDHLRMPGDVGLVMEFEAIYPSGWKSWLLLEDLWWKTHKDRIPFPANLTGRKRLTRYTGQIGDRFDKQQVIALITDD